MIDTSVVQTSSINGGETITTTNTITNNNNDNSDNSDIIGSVLNTIVDK